jgi:uncharacterized protein YjlB
MRRANDEHDAEVARRIAEVPLPAADPVLGANGPMFEHWR